MPDTANTAPLGSVENGGVAEVTLSDGKAVPAYSKTMRSNADCPPTRAVVGWARPLPDAARLTGRLQVNGSCAARTVGVVLVSAVLMVAEGASSVVGANASTGVAGAGRDGD